MFEGDLATLSTPDLLESAAEHHAEENRSAARLIEHAQIFADRHHPSACSPRPGRRSWEGRERSVVLGGDGCPEIAEFAPAEFGVMLGISPRVAADYLGQALALRHRFPFTWARVQAGEATPWRARLLTTTCIKLSEEAARYVDQRVAPILDTITPYRLDKIIKAAKFHADPEGARAEAEEKARERGVFVAHSDEHGSKTIYARAASGAVIRFDATIASIADALKILGDTRDLNTRRADALGIIADPAYTAELLLQARELPANTPTASPADTEPPTAPSAGDLLTDPVEPAWDDEADRDAPHPSDTDLHDPLDTPLTAPLDPAWPEPHVPTEPGEPLDPDARRALHTRLAEIKHKAHTNPTTRAGADRPGRRLRPGKTEIYVHLTDHTLATGDGVLRAETLGPLLASQLTELVGHGPYVVKPVIDLNEAISVDAYEIPDRIRERVKLVHPVELFPYGSRETHRTMDIDHIQPYDPLGPPGQTNTQNLAPLGRFTHRVKTHARGWNVHRLNYKTLEWTTPHGFTFQVTPTGTHRVPPPGRTPDPP
ncbi:uncharacterized protein DUF222 [Kribbella steppae]|uniref:Uncharacterized protein DUF222 n=1 Tax=Kribbella steppae TaxID=2512223 RepID=A0A4R2HCW1_9ACTN|nr:DUF222 domain-containing protein [Kribbella steppae]TCO26211.1 uncharacterized protein DUF222 [Kribbella steppae]